MRKRLRDASIDGTMVPEPGGQDSSRDKGAPLACPQPGGRLLAALVVPGV